MTLNFVTYFISKDIYQEYAIRQTRKCDEVFCRLDPPIYCFVLNDVTGQMISLENASKWRCARPETRFIICV